MRTTLTAFTLLGLCTALMRADDGFWTRNLKDSQQKTSYIECWRANTQSPTPERIATEYYNPQSNPSYLHWWVGGSGGLQIEYDWDYTFIGWLYENGDTLFTDYTPWTEYAEDVRDTFDLVLQYETTRPSMPPR